MITNTATSLQRSRSDQTCQQTIPSAMNGSTVIVPVAIRSAVSWQPADPDPTVVRHLPRLCDHLGGTYPARPQIVAPRVWTTPLRGRPAGPLGLPAVPRSHPLYRQLARVWRLSGRWLPNGWLDAIRQLALFAGAYYLYRIVRGFVDGQAGLAFENARTLVHFERSLGLFFEPGLQAWARGEEWLLDVRPTGCTSTRTSW